MSMWFDSFVDSFVFGAANSLHCACMCGPLALTLHGSVAGAISYHLGRISAYGSIGVVLGGLGAALGSNTLAAPGAIVSFVLAGGILLLVLFGDRGAVRIPVLSDLATKASARTRRLSPRLRALAFGLITPLLPCGLLWSAFAGATVAGSAVGGGTVMAAFALGTLPVLFLAQSLMPRMAARLGPRTVKFVQRAAMLLAAAALIYRGYANLGGGSCCH